MTAIFLASPKWSENLHEIIVQKIQVPFNQGLDIRLVDAQVARLLASCRYFDDQFKDERLHSDFGDILPTSTLLKKKQGFGPPLDSLWRKQLCAATEDTV